MAMTLWFDEESMKQINTPPYGKKGQQRMEQMAEIQKIVTSAGWLDQCQDGPPSMEFAEIEAEKLPPSQWMLLFRKNVNRSWLKETKSLLHNLKTNLARIQIRMMFEL